MQDLAAYGADASALPQRFRKPQHYKVWPEHWDTVAMFLRCQTQWRTGASGVIGLDYSVVLQLCSLQKIDDPVQLLDNLRVMEQRALERFRKTVEQQSKQQQRRR